MKRFQFGLAFALVAAFGLTSSFAASVKGTIHYKGELPKLKKIKMSADPQCEKLHKVPLTTEYVLVKDGKLKNVFLYIKSGLPKKTWPVPTETITFDQRGCQYTPHVFGLMVNQQFQILNSDATLHNVHAMPKTNKEFNIGMPVKNMKLNRKFDKVELGIRMKCDVHPWMRAFANVVDHPFFAVSSEDGNFEIKNLPAGKYVVGAWHEKMGEQEMEVTVAEGKDASLAFTFERKGKGAAK